MQFLASTGLLGERESPSEFGLNDPLVVALFCYISFLGGFLFLFL